MSLINKSLKALGLAGAFLLMVSTRAAAASGPAAETLSTRAPAFASLDSGFTVQLKYVAGLGNILAGDDGMTLYVFLKDSVGVSNCSGSCAVVWPPETLEPGAALSAGPGVTATLGSLFLSETSAVLTINGWPVYNFAKDKVPGDVNGQGLNGYWYVMDSSGALIRVPAMLNGPGAETPVPGAG